MNISNKRGGADVIILAAIIVIGAGWLAFKPLFSKDRKRARESIQTTENLVSSLDARAASAAASVTAIGTANSLAPDSTAKNFISREVPAALAKLPSPDPSALLEAEKRRNAVMEGRLEEANKLYEREAKKSAQLQAERDEAIAAKRAADLELAEAAALKAGAEQQRNIMVLGLGAFGVLLAFLWFTRISPKSLGLIAADIRAGEKPIVALDRYTTPFIQKLIRKHSKLATEPAD